MRLLLPGTPHLTYCTNIHPGESWAEVQRNLERFTLPVKQAISPDQPFGVGLRLSARAAAQLAIPAELERLREFLLSNGLYVFTFNGFPYGPFHGEPVKEEVYLPDWTDPARLDYTDRLADIMAALLPGDEQVTGTISTVPGAFREAVRSETTVEMMATMIARHAAHLYRVGEETGRRIALALEPEPCCYLEVTGDAVDFFQDHLWRRSTLQVFEALTGLSGGSAEEFMRDQVGICFDTCHMAVEYEGCEPAVRALQGAGIRITKAQITAGLEIAFDGTREDEARLTALHAFAEGVYLHQVVEKRGDELRRHADLPTALELWSAGDLPEECRVHFHVPVFREELGPFRGTQGYVAEFLELLRREPVAPHLELETYTWDVLPEAYRRESIVDAVAGELRWVLDRVRG
ncbi:MAG: metabolite traffic protein EboE [Gemmatimonadetes bacterium]|nr:metabolite traffic protein EboE [Gemmatimonadota bacterium]